MKELFVLLAAMGRLGCLLLGLGYGIAFLLHRSVDSGLTAILMFTVANYGEKEKDQEKTPLL